MSATKACEQYPYIVAWGALYKSSQQWVDAECQKALADGAPRNATQFEGGRWRTTDDITSAPTRVALGLEPLPAPGEEVKRMRGRTLQLTLTEPQYKALVSAIAAYDCELEDPAPDAGPTARDRGTLYRATVALNRAWRKAGEGRG